MMASNKSILPQREIYKGEVIYSKLREEMDQVESMNTRQDDVWVCSFPRSGTTMTQELVYHIMTLDFDTAKTVPQEERFPQLLEHAEVNNGITMFKEFTGLQHHERRASPRMIKSHLHYSLLPEQLRNGKGKVTSIFFHIKTIMLTNKMSGVIIITIPPSHTHGDITATYKIKE
ncbi:sulfotransferase 4A1-like [Ruditapes philippinarum]|uniref:sulfotransferase 4A1-like n=1 Tax=Ruditapes philippinarum TaxID=129788 RepID=UPI00295A74B1|nr:sulfotransferase 4A1-like [Ruditapes philippinarum]